VVPSGRILDGVNSMSDTRKRAIFAGISGNVLEWYDFAVYGYFAATIGSHFFPSDDPATSLIASFGAFAAGYMMRPLGSVFFGHIGDKYGRKPALTLSVILMAIPTFAIGLLPDYKTIGIAAPALLVALRMLQGASVGGEYTTSVVFLAEHATPGRRGLMASWSAWGACFGVLMGSAVGALISNAFSAEAVHNWMWRLPFLAGIVIGLIGLYIRRSVTETHKPEARTGFPIVEALRYHLKDLLRVSGLVLGYAVCFYTVFVYAATWLNQLVHVSKARALDINTLNMVALLLIIPVAAMLSDKIGRKPILIASMGGLAAFSYPLFWLMHHDSNLMIFLGQFGFAILIGLVVGVMPATLVEMAPPKLRVTIMSVGYNLTFGLFGGTAPMAAAYLVTTTHADYAPPIYLSCAALVSLLVVLTMKETAVAVLKRQTGHSKAQAKS